MKEYSVAIEFGSSKIVAIAGSRDAEGVLTVEAIEVEKVVNKIKHGCVQNVDEVFSYVKKLKTKLENRLPPAKIARTYVGVAGVSVFAEDKVTSKAFHEDSVITRAHVRKLEEECRALISKAYDVLAVVPVKYVIDGRTETNPVGMTGTNIEAHYKVVVAKPVLRRNIDRCIIERLKLPVAGYIPTALAVADVVLSKEDRTLGCVLIDFGAETTTVSVYKQNALVWLETLPMGGRNITRDIASLNMMEEEAEHLKVSSGMAKGFKSENNVLLKLEGTSRLEIDLAKLSSVVEARSEEIVSNVEEQIKRAGVDRSELSAGLVITGGAAKLRGWTELLEERLGMKVRQASLTKEIHVVDKESSRVNDYLQAVGLLNHATEICAKGILSQEAPEPDEDDDDERDENEQEKQPERKPGFLKRVASTFQKFVNEGESDPENSKD